MSTAARASWLEEWLKTVPPGTCPACRQPLPKHQGRGRPAYVHPVRLNPKCRAEYQRRRQAAVAGHTLLREVVARGESEPGLTFLFLDCGCVKILRASAARRIIGRTYCEKH